LAPVKNIQDGSRRLFVDAPPTSEVQLVQSVTVTLTGIFLLSQEHPQQDQVYGNKNVV
jgi:hypothetical protein